MQTAAPSNGWRGWLLQNLAGIAVSPVIRLTAAMILGFAGLFFVIAWQIGSQPTLDAMKFSTFTVHADARIVESWLALGFDPDEMGSHPYWRPFAKASPCVVAEYAGDWGQLARRAFCGNRFRFNDEYTLHDIDTIAPNVPFGWQRDARGFALAQVRLGAAAKAWLAAHAPADTFMLGDPPPKTELDALRVALDRPLDYAIAGWGKPLPVFPLTLDPKDPAGAMPASFVETHTHPQTVWRWVMVAVVAAMGLFAWTVGMGLLLSGLPRNAALLAGLLPLCALPWWGEQFPRALAHLNPQFASVISDMFADIDRTGRLIASTPREATLAGGETLIWHVGEGSYADTLGRIRFPAPAVSLSDGDAALASVAAIVTAQMQAFDASEQFKLFTRLRDDKRAGLDRAGLAFVPAARAALLDLRRSDRVRDAARSFLIAWLTMPTEVTNARDAGYRERVHVVASLADVPVAEIADSVRWTTHSDDNVHWADGRGTSSQR